MAFPTVANVESDVGALLGDPLLEKYTSAMQQPFFGFAYRELWDMLVLRGLQSVQATTPYTLPANTTSLTPATAGIANMGEPQRLWERLSGSTDEYEEMESVDDLPQFEPSAKLGYWKWEGDIFHFIGATTARQLKIEHSVSGVAPTSGTIALDNSRSFLALATAAHIAASPICGQDALAASLRVRAYGQSQLPDGTGGAMFLFLQPMGKEAQKRPVRPGRFRPRRSGQGQW
jgi:hypothetical protein